MGVVEIEAVAASQGLALEDVEAALRALPPAGRGRLSDHERRVLADLGVESPGRSRRALAAGAFRRSRLERDCLTTEQVAALLGREPSRVRQRLAGHDRSLLGFHRRGGRHEWLLPAFQFDHGVHDLPGWAALVRALPPADDTSPVALVAWLTDPKPHLGGRSRVEVLTDADDPVTVDMLVAEAATFGMVA